MCEKLIIDRGNGLKEEGQLVNDGVLMEIADGTQDLPQNRGDNDFLQALRKDTSKRSRHEPGNG